MTAQPAPLPLSSAEQAAVAAWLAGNSPTRGPAPMHRYAMPPAPAPVPPVHAFRPGDVVSPYIRHAARAGAARIELPEGHTISDFGCVVSGSRRGRRSSKA